MASSLPAGRTSTNCWLPDNTTRPSALLPACFEVKWDGVRALAAIEDCRWRLWGRHGSDYTERYPELAVLRRFPTGTIIDGELIVLQNGRADLPALLRRHQRSCSSALGP